MNSTALYRGMDFAMDGIHTPRRYRCLFQQEKEKNAAQQCLYVDPEHFAERGMQYLDSALQIMAKKSPYTLADHQKINHYLLLATDFSNKDAPFLLAARLLKKEAGLAFESSEIFVFLKLAADRGHAEAAYQLACCFAGMGNIAFAENICGHYLKSAPISKREQQAEHYFYIAMRQGHSSALDTLLTAYCYGNAYISQDAAKFIQLAESHFVQRAPKILLRYAAYLLGVMPDKRPLPNTAVFCPCDPEKSFKFLLKIMFEANFVLAQTALSLIEFLFDESVFLDAKSRKKYEQRLKEAVKSNQFLNLYAAWYSMPIEKRMGLPVYFDDYPCAFLGRIFEENLESATAFMERAIFGPREQLSRYAEHMLQSHFSSHYIPEVLQNA